MREYWKKMDQRMFDFQDFYQQVAEGLPDNAVIAEVGIADGASAIFLAEHLLNIKKKFRFYLIDDLSYGGTDQMHTIVQNLQQADLLAHVELFPYDSLNASCRFPDNHFDFVFIDASHRYEFTKADIRLWHHKIKLEEGLLAGHDYHGAEQVKLAADEVIPIVNRHTQKTSQGYGVWFVRSKQYVKLN